MSLEDIFKIHSLDSVSLKRFSVEKNFRLAMIDEDDWALDYSFQSNKDLFKRLEDSIIARGYTRFKHRNDETSTKTYVHEVFDYEFRLFRPTYNTSKYAIALLISPQ